MSFAAESPLKLEGLNKFLSIAYHQWIHYAIYAFSDLCVADQLIKAPSDHGFTVEEILGEDRKQWNSSLLSRILHACVYGGIVKLVNDDKHFVLTEAGKLLTSDNPLHARDYMVVLLGPVVIGACQQLSNVVRTGSTDSGMVLSTGYDYYTYVTRPENKEYLGLFSNTMTTTAALSAGILVENMDFSRFKTMIDIGGNRGTLLAQILKKFPNIEQGTVFDLQPVVNQHQNGAEFDTYKVSKDRWKFVAGNMFDASTLPQADAYIIKYVIHSLTDEQTVKTFQSIRKANENKKTPTSLYIVEHVILPNETVGGWQTVANDMLMAALQPGARERTVAEYEQFLKEGGFRLKKVHAIEAPQAVIEAELITN